VKFATETQSAPREFRINNRFLRVLCGSVVKTKFMADENEQSKERKSLDDRAKMTELERIRHSRAQAFYL
jgi:hypothetical protein